MLTSLSHAKASAGCRAFGSARPRVAPRISQVCQMARNSAYMVEVDNIADDEPEDVTVRRYMKLVMQSRVLEKLRARRTKETKIEEYKRRFRERVELRKAGFVEPTFDEVPHPIFDHPFDDFFNIRDKDDPDGPFDGMAAGNDDFLGTFGTGEQVWDNTSAQGGYVDGNASTWQGGYMN
ncbi:hypothetical protein Agub_g15163 [Astrephomene gubernaculifera]|uniref:Uncharacterized protein n=1 Tax=Astrephomene gubernaculifera TaxID=47775 RepID=A0AAD3E2K7_9CHLO|nr:hypothetical protein Agub_g15163 [Astrephomene gubernaculifera]